VVLGADGVSDFNALHSRQHDEEVQLYAFDILAVDGEDLRGLPLSMRKTNLARLRARRPTAPSRLPSSKARLAPSCSRRRATWGLKAWSRSVRTAVIGPDGRKNGSKVKNREHPATLASSHPSVAPVVGGSTTGTVATEPAEGFDNRRGLQA
jgi:bifunctional non-homologous end joining protein LigD